MRMVTNVKLMMQAKTAKVCLESSLDSWSGESHIATNNAIVKNYKGILLFSFNSFSTQNNYIFMQTIKIH